MTRRDAQGPFVVRLTKSFFVWFGITVAIALNVAVIGVGGWHFYRYVLAPRLGLVDTQAQFDEQFRVAVSPFRLLEEKEAALDRLLRMEAYATTLSEPERQALASQLDNIVYMEDYPLDLKYKAALVRSMLQGRPQQATPSAADRFADAATEVQLQRLQQWVTAETSLIQQTTALRTRRFVESFRKHPCDPELLKLLEQYLRRDDLPTVERSFLFGIRQQANDRCS